VENAIKEIRNKKATGDDHVPAEALKLLGDDGLNVLTQLIYNIYESGERSNDFSEVTMVTLKRSQKLENALIIAQSASLHMRRR
jgi:hypothetical protein